ncbi:MAG: TfoX family protein [Bacteroidetes bacterium]|nr:MAG: TfoX family protein [Bacteroidota bacterium]
MAYDTYLAERVSRFLKDERISYEEKKMMGGLCYMIDDKMCVGIVKNTLMARINPERYEELLTKPGAKEMNFTGRPMKGYIFIEPEGIDLDRDLEYWVRQCLEFNPLAKSSKKKK